MNIDKLYHIEHFDSFNNFYTIYKKHIVTKDKDYYKYVPIYGHYYNNSNDFICKKIIRKELLDISLPSNLLIVKDKDIVRTYNGGIHKCNNVDNLYIILDKIKNRES